MEKKTDNMIIIAATVLMLLMGIVMFYQNKTLNEYKQLLEKTDTVTYADTIYLDKVVRDTVPQVKTMTIFKCDTLWKVKGDSVVGEPHIITLVKKKSATH